ncbi:MAG: YqaE/Pmp3 family membrane protein [Opitutales bacterium]
MSKVLEIILTILLPPVGVFLRVGLGLHFWLNVVLTLLGWLPGVIHGLIIVLGSGGSPTHAHA